MAFVTLAEFAPLPSLLTRAPSSLLYRSSAKAEATSARAALQQRDDVALTIDRVAEPSDPVDLAHERLLTAPNRKPSHGVVDVVDIDRRHRAFDREVALDDRRFDAGLVGRSRLRVQVG
jgi:hypothetical protein